MIGRFLFFFGSCVCACVHRLIKIFFGFLWFLCHLISTPSHFVLLFISLLILVMNNQLGISSFILFCLLLLPVSIACLRHNDDIYIMRSACLSFVFLIVRPAEILLSVRLQEKKKLIFFFSFFLKTAPQKTVSFLFVFSAFT